MTQELLTPHSNHSVSPGWYVWNSPGCPLRIMLRLSLIERLRQEFGVNLGTGREFGGLLIGNRREGVTRIFEFVPVPASSDASERRFALPTTWLNDVIARCPPDSKVVGFYRSDADDLIRLRQEDVALMEQCFRDPSNACLVMAAAGGSGVNAGFFCWQSGVVAVNPNLTFPLSGRELLYYGWPLQIDGRFGQKLRRFFSEIGESLVRGSDFKVAAKVAVVAAACALLITAVASRWIDSGWTLLPQRSLGLQVQGDGTRFALTWNRSSSSIKNARAGDLVIWDSSRADSDGNTEPLHLPVPLPRLKSGGMIYTSFAPTEKVRFRLDVTDKSGSLRSEAITSLAPLAVKEPPQPPVLPVSRPRPRNITGLPASAKEETRSRKFSLPRPSSLAEAASRIVMVEPPSNILGAAEPQTRNVAMTDSAPPARVVIPVEVPLALASVAPPPRPAPPPASPGNASLPGMLTITSEPTSADVQINGIPAGVTPLSIQISPVGLGFTVTVTKEGYSKWSLQTSAMDKPYSLHAQLKQGR